jgi:competence protein ComEC
VVLIAMLAYAFSSRPTDKLVVTFFDIGQGDSIYIKSPSGIEMLIDAGGDKTVLQRLGKQMAWFDKTLDIVLATHPDKDHIGGIPEVLNTYKVLLFIESGSTSKNGIYEEVDTILKEKQNRGLVRKEAFAGQRIDLGSGVVFTILFPERDVTNLDTNDASIVGVLTYGSHSILLTGDAGLMTEYSIIDQLPRDITVLKVGHHGSDSSTSFELLEKTTPEVAILSLGTNNSYGHPHKKVTDLLNQFKVVTHRTDSHGSISFVSDGETFDITTAK